MRVKLECEKCGATSEIHILGGWDIETVRHYCGPRHQLGIPSLNGRALKPGEFAVAYNPPRRVF